ncbi:DnaJ-domain-containing protein [Rickenella mellea]|uniref:DnaJ-domain-containing protein n=1 Tax=Rickenella mellea TaxID=50990 RepID=A0A4Y7QEU5_9AGAM|nr:DnaJ-domain-containing protein [Rickenella mellea]
MAVETELYDLLGVETTASEGDIKKAYRKKAKEHHPDKNPNDPEASEKFQAMAAAYEILVDQDSREMYDCHGMEGLTGGSSHGGPGYDPADLFAEFFGGAGFQFSFGGPGAGPGRRRKGQDSVIPYDATLEDLYNGKHVKMNVEKEIICVQCKGTGAKGNAKPKECIKCEGNGWTRVTSSLGGNQFGTSKTACMECEGSGMKLRDKDRCKKCKGRKTVQEKKRQEIFIEKGMTDRQRIVLTGEGDQEPDMPTGDVVFVLKAQHHESFERSGNDLLTTVKITLSESLLGFSRVLITHLDGRGIRVTSPSNRIIKPQDTMILRGEGMPQYKHPDQKGNLYIVFDVEFPSEDWLQSVDRTALTALLPPKKPELSPTPVVVDDAQYEDGDIVDVRARSFPAGSDFLNGSFTSQFGEGGDEAWTDEDEDEGPEPECRHQ